MLLPSLFLAVPILAVAVASAAESHPFNVRDLVAFDRIAEPTVSPDGKTVAFSVSSLDLDANKRRSDLWTVALDGSDPRQLTRDPASDSGPAWSPDGRWIWFLSTRSGSSQVWKIPVDGGEARQVTKLPLDVGSFRLSPDGARLAVSMEVFPGSTAEETAKRLEERSKSKPSGRLYDRLLYRHWDTWKDGRRSHLFVLPSEGGDPVDVMKAMDADAPSKPFGGNEEYAFTPDGKGLVLTARDAGREEAWSTNLDLWIAQADGSAAPRNLTAANPATDSQPSFSPDGKTLAWLAMSRAGYESDRNRVMVMAWPGGSPRELAPEWDRSPGGLSWSRDGKSLYATADNLGHQSLFALDAATGAVREVVKEGHARSPVDAGGRIVLGMDSFRSPVELHTVKPDGSGIVKITGLNDERRSGVRMGEPSQFTFRGAGGDVVHGWIVKPVDFDAKKKYPVAFLIHGGPQGSWSNDFHYRWNPQAYAGAGYAAVMVDFHGSTGYGQDFTDSIRGDWGGKPFEDLQKGLAAALDANPWMDGDRVCALGASYGGYMINWIAGNWPDRFRCLVSHDGNLDERFAYFDTEELWFPEWEHHGTPWDNPEAYAKHNPIDHVSKWKTPMLIIHGALDYRVVDTQGMAAFTALQRKGIPSKFLHFPDENHWVLKPHNSIQWHDTVLDWLAEWTK
jgi:dipeptidyl aminopeptidase/acylaminoacyl peptidase